MRILDFLVGIKVPVDLISMMLLLVILGILITVMRKKNGSNSSDKKLDDFYFNIKQQIQFAVAPKSMEISLGVSDLVELAVEVWRIEQRIAKTIATIPESQAKGLENSIQKLRRYLEKYDLEIIDYTNQKFNDGLNLDVLSVEKDPNIKDPIVKETVEPTILCKGQVVKKAKIILLSN